MKLMEYNESASWNIGEEQSLSCVVDHDDHNYADHAAFFYVEQVVFSDRSTFPNHDKVDLGGLPTRGKGKFDILK